MCTDISPSLGNDERGMMNDEYEAAASGFNSSFRVHHSAFPSVSLPEVRAQKVEQREEENPDDVNEVPVESEVLDGRVVLRREASAPGPPHYRRDDEDADDHVERVQARHGEVEPEEHLVLAERDARRDVGKNLLAGVEPTGDWYQPVRIFLAVLESLHAEERQTQKHRRRHEGDLAFGRAARLRGPDGERHRQARSDEHGGVEWADLPVEVVAGGPEGLGVLHTVDEVGEEEPAEEHHLLRDEDPHAERAGLALLFEVVELVRQRRVRRLGAVAVLDCLRVRCQTSHLLNSRESSIVNRE